MSTTHEYLPPVVDDLSLISDDNPIVAAGMIHIFEGIGVTLLPQIYISIVALWLAVIIVNFLLIPGCFDMGLRDFGLLLAALVLGRLSQFTGRIKCARRLHDEKEPTGTTQGVYESRC